MITPDLARELLAYDPETGVLTWKRREMRHFTCLRECEAWNGQYAGREAGCLVVRRDGYRVIKVGIMGRLYRAHRVIWMIMKGEHPPKEIDHKDRDGANNRWSNLRSSTHKENHRNMSLFKTNTSGVPGVCWRKDIGKWQVRVPVSGKTRYLGVFSTLLDAAAARKSAERENHFDPGHGQPRSF